VACRDVYSVWCGVMCVCGCGVLCGVWVVFVCWCLPGVCVNVCVCVGVPIHVCLVCVDVWYVLCLRRYFLDVGMCVWFATSSRACAIVCVCVRVLVLLKFGILSSRLCGRACTAPVDICARPHVDVGASSMCLLVSVSKVDVSMRLCLCVWLCVCVCVCLGQGLGLGLCLCRRCLFSVCVCVCVAVCVSV